MSLTDMLLSVNDESIVDREANKKIIKAPFAWLGGKSYLCDQINDILPHSKTYVEVFGGSGITLLKRQPSEIEVFNDRNSGITDFYLTLQEDYQYLVDGVNELLCSKEMFYYWQQNWEKIEDRKLRALLWYYVIRTSWGGKMKYFGLEKTKDPTRRLYVNLPFFAEINKRLHNVVIENHDYQSLMNYYDDEETVFYLDPPYSNCEKNEDYYDFTVDHEEMLDLIFQMKGYVMVSNFESNQYLARDWDEVIQVEQRYSMHRAGKNNTKRQEMLYVKEPS